MARTFRCAITGALTLRREFEPGLPSNPRRLNHYGRFKRGAAAKRHRINGLHDDAIREDMERVSAR